MANLNYTDYEIKFGVKKIRFNLKIRTVLSVEKLVIVLLEVPYSDNKTLNNIHAFNLLGDEVWTVQPVPEKYPKLKNYLPFENLVYSNDKLSATDFMGRRFFIDTKDGSLSDMDIVK